MVRVEVLDTDSQKILGSTEMPNGGGTPMFSRDDSQLFIPNEVGYVGWKYITGEKSKVAESSPRPSEFGFMMDDSGWNYDRTIAIEYPHTSQTTMGKAKSKDIDPGQIAVSGGKTFEIGIDNRAGFDQFGNAWFGKGGNWRRVDRSGQVDQENHPNAIAHDQTRDRGSMHLLQTESDLKQGDATAEVSCIWLTDDKSIPHKWMEKGKTMTESHKVALVFAGADVIDYGFLPGRDMVYIVSGFGIGDKGPLIQTQLIPFSLVKAHE